MSKFKWTPMQRKALSEHIGEWRAILAGTRWEAARDNACCRVFNKVLSEMGCTRCPIALYSGEKLCFGTPYRDWLKAARPSPTGSGQEFLGYGAGNDRSRKAAQKMLAYLEAAMDAGVQRVKTFKKVKMNKRMKTKRRK
jgi:hypothetical protein